MKMASSVGRLELVISHVLRTGVLTSGVCLAVGWIGLWIEYGDGLATKFSTYYSESMVERIQWSVFVQDRPMLIAYLGLSILVLLPMVRVGLVGYLFAKQREVGMALLSFLVFFALVASFLMGINIH